MLHETPFGNFTWLHSMGETTCHKSFGRFRIHRAECTPLTDQVSTVEITAVKCSPEDPMCHTWQQDTPGLSNSRWTWGMTELLSALRGASSRAHRFILLLSSPSSYRIGNGASLHRLHRACFLCLTLGVVVCFVFILFCKNLWALLICSQIGPTSQWFGGRSISVDEWWGLRSGHRSPLRQAAEGHDKGQLCVLGAAEHPALAAPDHGCHGSVSPAGGSTLPPVAPGHFTGPLLSSPLWDPASDMVPVSPSTYAD